LPKQYFLTGSIVAPPPPASDLLRFGGGAKVSFSATLAFLFNLDNDLLEVEITGAVAPAKAGDTGVCDRGEENL